MPRLKIILKMHLIINIILFMMKIKNLNYKFLQFKIINNMKRIKILVNNKIIMNRKIKI